MKYRICMNGNGRFIIERKEWRLGQWRPLGQSGNNQPSFEYWHDLLVFETSEAACKALLNAQEDDRRAEREEKWTTVVEETRGNKMILKTSGTLIIIASVAALLAFAISGDSLGMILSLAALLVGATMLTENPDVTTQWLREQERASWRVGVEQSRSTWPWKR